MPVGDEMARTAHQRVVLDTRMMVRAAGGLCIHVGFPRPVDRGKSLARAGG
jgi:hypothetical protein